MRHNIVSLKLKYNHSTTEYRSIFSRYLPWSKISGTAQHYLVLSSSWPCPRLLASASFLLNLYCIKGALALFVLVSFSGYVC